MNIGIIGGGNVGTGLAKRLVPKRHEVMLSYSRDVAKLKGAAASLGASAGRIATTTTNRYSSIPVMRRFCQVGLASSRHGNVLER